MIEYDPSVEGELTVYLGVRRTPSHSINTAFVLIDRPHFHVWRVIRTGRLVLRAQPWGGAATDM